MVRYDRAFIDDRGDGNIELKAGSVRTGRALRITPRFQLLTWSGRPDSNRRPSTPARRSTTPTKQIADGKPVPTPQEVVAAIGPSVGFAIEVLNEFPEYEKAFQARREQVQ